MNMTSRERFLTALQLKEPDRVPVFDFLMCKGIFRETLGTEEVKNTATENFAASLVLGLDSVYLPLNPASTYKIKFIKENVYVDEWGEIMKIDPVSWPINAPYEFVIKNKNDLKNLKVPDPVDPARFEEMRKVVEINKGRIALSVAMEGPMTRAWYLMGLIESCGIYIIILYY